MTETAPTTALPAGWYPDQLDAGYYRWWDGQSWTEHRQRVQLDPPPVGVVPPAPPAAPAPPPADPYPYPSPPRTAAPQRRNAVATWSLILGILAVLSLLLPYVGLVFGILAVLFGIAGVRAAHSRDRGRGVAIAGIVTGGVASLVGVVIAVSFTMFLASPDRQDAALEPNTSAQAPADDDAQSGALPEAPADDDVDEGSSTVDTLDPATFVLRSGNDLDDIDKDLQDMTVTLDEAGFWRLLTNSVELSFNHAQLAARTAPDEIAEEWKKGLTALETTIEEMDAAIVDERTDDVRTLIDAAHDDVRSLRELLDAVKQ